MKEEEKNNQVKISYFLKKAFGLFLKLFMAQNQIKSKREKKERKEGRNKRR